MSNLPDYHCPECDDIDCLHCFCIDETDCESCIEYAKEDSVISNSVDHEAFDRYMKLSAELRSELIASEGQELFDAKEHWVNNPLITPINKVALFEEAIARAEKKTEEHIIKLLEEQKATHEEKIAQWSEASFHRFQELELAIALIKRKK